jgi:polyferredoxin
VVRSGGRMKRFAPPALATLAGYVAAMSALLAAILGWSLYSMMGLVPVPSGSFVGVFVFSLIALLGAWGHVAILRRSRVAITATQPDVGRQMRQP